MKCVSPSFAAKIHCNGDDWSACYLRCMDGWSLTNSNSKYVCIAVWSCCCCSPQCDRVLSFSFVVKIYCNGDDLPAFIFVDWMERCCFCPEQTACTFICFAVRLALKLFFVLKLCEVRFSSSCAIKMCFNDDDRSAWISGECMERYRVGPGRKASKFVLLCACFRNFYEGSVSCGVVISPSSAIKICYIGNNRCAFIFIQWMERCRVGPGRTGGMFWSPCLLLKALFMFDAVWGRNLTLICCQNILQWWCLVGVYLRSKHGTMSCWPWINRRYVCIAMCLLSKPLFVSDAVWGWNFTLISCHNILQWWCSVCAYLCSMDGNMPCVACTNSRYVYMAAVCSLSKLLFIFEALWGRSLTLISCQNISPHDARCAFIFVQCMQRSGLTDCTSVLLCACFQSFHLCSMQYEVVSSPSFLVKIHYDGDARCVWWMERCRVCSGRTGGTFVLLYACFRSFNSRSTQCEVVVSPALLVKYTIMVMMLGVRLSSCNGWNGVVLALH